MNISPLIIYHFPCNVTFNGMQTSLSFCPERMSMSLPLFEEELITYVKWDSTIDDNLLHLHHKSLSIPPPITINKTLITELDQEINWYDDQLTKRINKANKEIEKIKETSFTTFQVVLIYAAFTLSIINFVLMCVCCSCLLNYCRAVPPSVTSYEVNKQQTVPPLPPKQRMHMKKPHRVKRNNYEGKEENEHSK